MVKLEAHKVAPAKARASLERSRRSLGGIKRNLDIDLKTHHLDASSRAARDGIDAMARVGADAAELLGWARFAARAKAALFTFARRPERSQFWLLDAWRSLHVEPGPEALQASEWRTGFWLAWATRDAHALALLLLVPPELVEEWEPFDRPLVRALQALATRSPDTGALLVAALELTDPELVNRTSPDWVLDILAPVFECLLPLADRDEAGFRSGVTKLLELRREHFAKGRGKGEEDVQNLSEEAAGLLAWASAVGMDVEVRCPYVPEALAAPPAPAFEACSACATPLGEGAERCSACGQEAADRQLHFDLGGWLALERAACPSCACRYPVIVKRCPRCLTSTTGR